ncbi:MAG: S8 family serine peptidase [Panacagrimonas sp.]
MRFHLAGAIFLLVLLAACGGGGQDDSGSTPGPAFQISGAMRPGADSAIDSDTADLTVSRTPNDSPDAPQAIRNPVTLGGYVSRFLDAGGNTTPDSDEFDVFRVDLAGGQVIQLFIAEDGSADDLDLVLADSNRNVVAESLGTDKFEVIEVPGTGSASYFLQVRAFSGASNYVLSITQQGQFTAAGALHGMRTQAEFVPDQVLVSYVKDMQGERPVLAKSMGGQWLAGIPGGVDLLDLSSPAGAKALAEPRLNGFRYDDPALAAKVRTLTAIKTMQRNPDVEFAEPNLIRRASAVPDDEFFEQQWHYNLINLPQAWDITQGSGNVIVAVADTGVRLNHPDLSGKFDPDDPNGFDFVDDPNRALDGSGIDGNADDPGDGGVVGGSSFHGTHVAGTIGARTDDGTGVAGAGWDTRIMPLRVLGEGGSGNAFDIVNAVLYAARLSNATGQLPARRADIINLSLGSDSASQSEANAYRDAVAAGLIVIAAAGNSGDSRQSFPASYPGVVSVAAVGRQKQRAPYSQFNNAVDVAAPGGDQSRAGADGVLSTLSSDSSGTIRDGLGFLQGTSMAAPHMAGVVALMKAVNRGLTPAQLDQLLASGAITEDLGASGRDNSFGHGLIDANKAVREAIRLASGAAPADNPSLSVQPESLDFGNSTTRALLDAANAGTGDLAVTSVSDNAPWLSVSAQSIDSDGLGAYAVSVNRSGLANGSYSANIVFASSINTVSVPVLLTVGGIAGTVDAGKQYVLLVDADTLEPVAQDEVEISGGRYAYRLSAPSGQYLLVAGTDSDNDGSVCDDGEACGGFPTLDALTPITVEGAARSGIDFLTSFDLSAPSSQSTSARREGYRLMR